MCVAFLIKTAIKVEEGNLRKIIKKQLESHTFRRSGACFERSKSINKRLRKRNKFWRAFLIDCDSILEAILEAILETISDSISEANSEADLEATFIIAST